MNAMVVSQLNRSEFNNPTIFLLYLSMFSTKQKERDPTIILLYVCHLSPVFRLDTAEC